MDKLAVELQDGYFVEIDSLNHTLRQRYAGQDKDGNEKESVRTIGYFGDMKQCIKALLERYPRELSEKAQFPLVNTWNCWIRLIRGQNSL